jgi:hypothetical protein
MSSRGEPGFRLGFARFGSQDTFDHQQIRARGALSQMPL